MAKNILLSLDPKSSAPFIGERKPMPENLPSTAGSSVHSSVRTNADLSDNIVSQLRSSVKIVRAHADAQRKADCLARPYDKINRSPREPPSRARRQSRISEQSAMRRAIFRRPRKRRFMQQSGEQRLPCRSKTAVKRTKYVRTARNRLRGVQTLVWGKNKVKSTILRHLCQT